jgi:hypothetical protein
MVVVVVVVVVSNHMRPLFVERRMKMRNNNVEISICRLAWAV